MPSDYGDEAGGRLLDWMLRIGQDAGSAAAARSAESLAELIRNARTRDTEPATRALEAASERYVKLNLSEFQALPDYGEIKRAIGESLDVAAIEHAFASEEGADFVVFKAEHAPEVDSALGRLEATARDAASKAKAGFEAGEGAERLEERAEAARDAARAYNALREQGREIERTVGRSR